MSLYVFRTVFPSIIRSSRLYIQHQVYVIQVSWLFASGPRLGSWTPDDGQKDGTKHVEWHSINSKIVHLFGFTIEWNYHSSRCNNPKNGITRNYGPSIRLVQSLGCQLLLGMFRVWCWTTATVNITLLGFTSHRRCPYFDVVVGLVWSYDTESYAGGSLCYR